MIDRCITGDQDAWRRFVDRYAPVIYTAVRRVLEKRGRAGDTETANDIAQEVFVRLVREDSRLLRAFDPARASIVTYLTVIAHSTAIDQTRRLRIPTQPLDAVPEPLADADGPAEPIALPADLLSPRQHLVMTLLFEKEMTVAEAAGVLGVDAQTIRSTKHKAILKLREYFEKK